MSAFLFPNIFKRFKSPLNVSKSVNNILAKEELIVELLKVILWLYGNVNEADVKFWTICNEFVSFDDVS